MSNAQYFQSVFGYTVENEIILEPLDAPGANIAQRWITEATTPPYERVLGESLYCPVQA